MIRRRRPVREVAFSFDSFLDVVTNVVGIIIRLILVVWVSARSYTSVQQLYHKAAAKSAPLAALPEVNDPLQQELERQREELERAQARLLAQLRQLQLTEDQQQEVAKAVASLDSRREELDHESALLDRDAKERSNRVQVVTCSFKELKERQDKLTQELKDLEKQPSLKQTLRYRTPVSHPVQNEELLFECARGRVTFLDVATMLGEIKDGLEEKGKLLRNLWEVSDVTRPAGAFRLRYTIERQRDTLDAAFGTATPSARGEYSYGMSEWVAEPVAPVRGETGNAALVKGSQFRLLVDALDPQQSVVTFWVYPDSFPIYRQLRDHLYERDITVAGRPMPDGMPISCTRRGSRSRGQ